MNTNVLVLNQDYSPLSICSTYRAFILVFLNKADLIHEYEDEPFLSITDAFARPSVIKVRKYVSVPYRSVTLNRLNVFKRDNFECAYCGSLKDLTLDHIIPRSKGGKTTWKNVITACQICNIKKGDKDLEFSGMALKIQPFKPSPFLYLADKNGRVREEWKNYL